MRITSSGAVPFAAVLLSVLMLSGCGEHGAEDHSGNHGDHGDHEEHKDNKNGGHRDHKSGKGIALDDEVIHEFGIEVRRAASGQLAITRTLPGEIRFDEALMTHVTPRVAGRAEKVRRYTGDRVEKGEVLAVLSSTELAEARSQYLSRQARLELEQADFERTQQLAKDRAVSEAELQRARQALKEARVRMTLARRRLEALGMAPQAVAELDTEGSDSLARYELRAPASGTIIEQHLTRGERVDTDRDDPPFVIARRDQVWAEFSVFPRSLGEIRPGQVVEVSASEGGNRASGTISYITPRMAQDSRSASARVVLDNSDGQWYPGQFVTGEVTVRELEADVVVPASAIQRLDDQPHVFVRTDHGFRRQPVRTGISAGSRVIIREGLDAGTRYAATNTFTLKAEAGRAQLKHAGHSH